MKNEPVAWMYRMRDSLSKWELIFNKPINDEFFETIPLYTHPADLTDEEILNCTGFLPKYNSEIVDEDLVKFARAILRKAQENG